MTITEGEVKIDGHSYPLRDLSLRGFVVRSYTGDHEEGDWVVINISVELGETELDMSGQGRVVWISRGEQELGAAVFGMAPDWYMAIDRYLQSAASED